MLKHDKPYAPSCDRNKDSILKILQKELVEEQTVLEIGSGTGQHAIYFAEHLPHVQWLTSDLADKHQGISAWIKETEQTNILGPIEIDAQTKWSIEGQIGSVFTANTLHIMCEESALSTIKKAAQLLSKNGKLLIYGPFKYNNIFTSESNQKFDLWLKEQNSVSGIRDFEKINQAAIQSELSLISDNSMPANNQLLVWKKN
jgi:cyclopropane fatty-acyl-phospholipid synthase-like methyltransferase